MQSTTTSSDTQDRARYFPRQIVLPADLLQDQAYFLARSRRANRILHGFGVAEKGLQIKAFSPERAADLVNKTLLPAGGNLEKTWIEVTPGYAHAPNGDVLYLPEPMFLNTKLVIHHALVTSRSICRNEAAQQVLRDGKWYLVVETVVSEVEPIQAAGSRCSDSAHNFEYSRLRDQLRFHLVEGGRLVAPYGDANAGDDVDLNRLIGNVKRAFVCLGSVTFDADGVLYVDATDLRDALPVPSAPPALAPVPAPVPKPPPVIKPPPNDDFRIFAWSVFSVLAAIAMLLILRWCGIV